MTYDPSKMPLRRLVEAFFVIIDPLSVNRQGKDEGTRYRTGIYWEDAADVAAIEEAYSREEEWQGSPLAVEVEPLRNFYPAEEEHQDYLIKHADGYCHVDLKVLRYADLLKELASLVEGVQDEVAVMANTAALLHETMRFFWTGFYRVVGEKLALGPFQGRWHATASAMERVSAARRGSGLRVWWSKMLRPSRGTSPVIRLPILRSCCLSAAAAG